MSVVADMQLVTNEIRIKNNNFADGEFTMKPSFTRKTGIMQDGRHFTELSVSLLNTENNPFPVDVYVCITGIFDLGRFDAKTIDTFLKKNAVQILLPYLRTIVSSVTATAMMTPIILPIINSDTLFSKNDKEDG